MDKPKDTKQFLEFEVEGIKVYINKLMEVKDNGIDLSLSGFLFFKTIEAKGIKLDL